MTKSDPNPTPPEPLESSPAPEGETPPPPAPKRRRRRWPWVIAIIVLVLFSIVASAPTLLSMGWGRELVVGQINSRINGHAEIADWSLGWFSGVKLDGLVIYDESNRQILQLPQLRSGLSLWNAIWGRYDLGKTQIDRLDVLVSREADGSLNWSHLSKSGPAPANPPPAKSPTTSPAHQTPKAEKLPDIRGELVLNNATITYEDPASGAQPVFVRSIQGDLKAADVNQPINTTLSAQVQVSPAAGQTGPPNQIDFVSDVGLDPATRTLDLRSVTAKTLNTDALALMLKGKVTDIGGSQKIENALTADIDYDAAALWKLILPLMSKSSQEKMAAAKVAGKFHKQFEIRGAFPSGNSFAQAIQQITGNGDLQLDLFDAQGVTLKQVDVPIVLKNGALEIANAAAASTRPSTQTASFNGGTLNLAGCSIDLRDPHLRLSAPKGLALVHNATLNPIFASWWLGQVLNNPMFVKSTEASGLLSLTIDNCTRLPLDSTITSANDGNATLDISIMGLHVGNPMLQQIADAVRVNLNSFQGNVKDYRVTIANGVVHQDFNMSVGEHQRPLHLAGDVRKSNNQMLGFNLDLPLKDLGANIDKNVRGFLPDTISIPLGGTSDNPQPQVDLAKIIADATQKALKQNVLGGILPGSTTQPSDQNPIQQLEDLFGKKKKPKSH